MHLFTRPQVSITLEADNIEVQGLNSPSGLEPTFHVIRRAAPVVGEAPWVIVGGPGFEPTQPAQYVLNVFRRHEWPPDAAAMWGDYVALLFATLLPRASGLPRRRPDVHVHVREPMAQQDRDEFETRSRQALVGRGARSVSFEWTTPSAIVPRSSVLHGHSVRQDVHVVTSATTEHYRAALEAGASGDLRRARNELEAVLEAEPTHTSAKLRLRILQDARAGAINDATAVHLFRAALLSTAGSHQDALEQIDSAMAASPTYAEVFRLRGRTLVDLGDVSRAIAEFSHALALDPSNVAAFLNRGAAYLRVGDVAKALADFTAATTLEPTNAEAYVNRGTAYVAGDRAREAIRDFDRAIELDGGSGPAYNNKALLHESLGEWSSALTTYKALVARSRPEFQALAEHAKVRIRDLSPP